MFDTTESINIKGIVSVPGSETVGKNDFYEYFEKEDVDKIQSVTGIESLRVVKEDQCVSDLMLIAGEKLIKSIGWKPEEIKVLVVVTQSSDYQLPATSCLLQDKLNLSTNCACLDINLGCSGYVYGIWLMSKLLNLNNKNGLLLVGDTSSKMVCPYDRATAMLFGDAGTATALEFDPDSSKKYFSLCTDGGGAKNLIIPSSGYRIPVTEKTLKRETTNAEHKPALTDLYMDGTEIFKFTLAQAIPSIKEIISKYEIKPTEIDYYVFHQANLFLIQHIIKKLKLEKSKVLTSIRYFGNTSSASIPLTMTEHFSKMKLKRDSSFLLSGFGVGYSWGNIFMDIKKDTFFETLP